MDRTDPIIDTMTVRLGGSETAIMPYVSEIVPGLWQGGCPIPGLVLPERFSHVVNLFGIFEYRQDHVPETSMIVDMSDSIKQNMSIVEPIAQMVSRLDGDVLVHCQAGLNRSGVVVARCLMLRGMSAEDAISFVRDHRHQRALNNDHFVEWLLLLDK